MYLRVLGKRLWKLQGVLLAWKYWSLNLSVKVIIELPELSKGKIAKSKYMPVCYLCLTSPIQPLMKDINYLVSDDRFLIILSIPSIDKLSQW